MNPIRANFVEMKPLLQLKQLCLAVTGLALLALYVRFVYVYVYVYVRFVYPTSFGLD